MTRFHARPPARVGEALVARLRRQGWKHHGTAGRPDCSFDEGGCSGDA